MVGALRFSAPARTRTQHRPHTPTPPQELPIGTSARRAASSTVSFAIASAVLHNGVNVTRIRGFSHLATKLSAPAGVYTCKTSEEFNEQRDQDDGRNETCRGDCGDA